MAACARPGSSPTPDRTAIAFDAAVEARVAARLAGSPTPTASEPRPIALFTATSVSAEPTQLPPPTAARAKLADEPMRAPTAFPAKLAEPPKGVPTATPRSPETTQSTSSEINLYKDPNGRSRFEVSLPKNIQIKPTETPNGAYLFSSTDKDEIGQPKTAFVVMAYDAGNPAITELTKGIQDNISAKKLPDTEVSKKPASTWILRDTGARIVVATVITEDKGTWVTLLSSADPSESRVIEQNKQILSTFKINTPSSENRASAPTPAFLESAKPSIPAKFPTTEIGPGKKWYETDRPIGRIRFPDSSSAWTKQNRPENEPETFLSTVQSKRSSGQPVASIMIYTSLRDSHQSAREYIRDRVDAGLPQESIKINGYDTVYQTHKKPDWTFKQALFVDADNRAFMIVLNAESDQAQIIQNFEESIRNIQVLPIDPLVKEDYMRKNPTPTPGPARALPAEPAKVGVASNNQRPFEATAAPAKPMAQAELPTNWIRQFVSPQFPYTIDYPAGWQYAKDPKGDGFMAPTKGFESFTYFQVNATLPTQQDSWKKKEDLMSERVIQIEQAGGRMSSRITDITVDGSPVLMMSFNSPGLTSTSPARETVVATFIGNGRQWVVLGTNILTEGSYMETMKTVVKSIHFRK